MTASSSLSLTIKDTRFSELEVDALGLAVDERADHGGGEAKRAEVGAASGGGGGGDAEEEAAGRLRVAREREAELAAAESVGRRRRDGAVGPVEARREEVAVGLAAARDAARGRVALGAGQEWQRREIDASRERRSTEDVAQVPEQREAGDVGHRGHAVRAANRERAAVQRRHRRARRSNLLGRSFARL